MSDLREIECRATGRVQGVLFRDFVRRKARALSLKGFVENEDDGSVHLVAQGGEEDLEKLIEHLHKGPFLAKVARVDVHRRKPTTSFDGFSIKYYRT